MAIKREKAPHCYALHVLFECLLLQVNFRSLFFQTDRIQGSVSVLIDTSMVLANLIEFWGSTELLGVHGAFGGPQSFWGSTEQKKG